MKIRQRRLHQILFSVPLPPQLPGGKQDFDPPIPTKLRTGVAMVAILAQFGTFQPLGFVPTVFVPDTPRISMLRRISMARAP